MLPRHFLFSIAAALTACSPAEEPTDPCAASAAPGSTAWAAPGSTAWAAPGSTAWAAPGSTAWAATTTDPPSAKRAFERCPDKAKSKPAPTAQP